MKRTVFYLALAGCAFGVMAQQGIETSVEEPLGYEYVPIVREGVEWGYEWYVASVYGKTSSYYIQFDGDTVIGGKTYKKCYRYNSWYLVQPNARLAGFAREENHKVYAIIKLRGDGAPLWQESEQLIYDFDAPAGTEIRINNTYYGTVSRIEYINLRGQWRKAIYTYFGESGDKEYLYAVEGLGIVLPSVGYLLDPHPDREACILCYENHLNYVSDYPQCEGAEYRAEFEYCYDEDYEQIKGSVETVEADGPGLQVSQGDSWLRVAVGCDCYRRAELTDSKGSVVDSVELHGDEVVEFSTYGLPSGVYVVSLVSDSAVRSEKVLIK